MFRQVLQQASFRGIKFSVLVSEEKDATTYAVHRFPGQFEKKAIPEKIGPDPKFFPIQAMLLGESRYFTLSLLKMAKARKGPGKLIHPTAGMLDAYLASIASVERIDKLGMIRLKLEFIEAPEDLRSKNVFDKISSSLAKAKALLDDAAASFIEAFSIVDMPAYLVAQTASLVQNVRHIISSENGAGRLASAVSDLGRSTESLAGEAKSLIEAPEKLAQDIVASLKTITALEDSKRVTDDLALVPRPENKELAKNTDALMSLACSVLFVEGISKMVQQIEAKELSRANLKDILEHLEKILTLAISRADYGGSLSLQTFFAEVKNWVLNEVDYLQKIKSQMIYEETPALILAWKLYGDLSKEGEIIKRQEGENPLKIAGSVEVFND